MPARTAAVRDSSDGALLQVHVQPGASRTEWSGYHGDTLKFRVAAAPEKGAANAALCEFLARRFGVPNSAITVTRGATARRKQVLVRGLTAAGVLGALEPGK